MIAIILFALAAFVLTYAVPGPLGFILAIGLPVLIAILTAFTEGAGDIAIGNLIITLVLVVAAAFLGAMVRERTGQEPGGSTPRAA
ncbi:MAG TPA: hypothetical protein VNT32_13270 [Thermoleophilaceae bacterium]|nr:hypothetical protein [Thermoleophilaceae bacterium]